MVITLISATPSPFARINRIALIEKGIPFELKNEVPWDSTTVTPMYNPLEKLPVMLLDDGTPPIYDSSHIQEYIVQKFKQGDSLLPENIDDILKAKQLQVLAQGMMDAVALNFFEQGRGEKMSQEWFARQNRKLCGGMKAFSEMVKTLDGDYLVANKYTIADIAAGSAIGMVDFAIGIANFEDLRDWRAKYPELEKYYLKLEERESFKQTKPVMFEIQDKIV